MKLSEFLSGYGGIILLDGAMGTQLAEMGYAMGGQNCITNPDAVLAVHRKYMECGIDLLTTNTLTMNRVFLEMHNVKVDVNEVNKAGVRLAKEAAGSRYVLGDVSSTGKLLKPAGKLDPGDAYKSFFEQASIFASEGVDGFIIETMIDLKEAVQAVRACRDAAGIPVIATMSFDTLKKGGRTVMGNSAEECAKALAEEGASAIGANCGSLDPFQIAEIVFIMKKFTTVPVVAQPNAGKPRVENGKSYFDMTPTDFASGLMKCVEAGAKLVGGCCGTSPTHIKAVSEMLKKI